MPTEKQLTPYETIQMALDRLRARADVRKRKSDGKDSSVAVDFLLVRNAEEALQELQTRPATARKGATV